MVKCYFPGCVSTETHRKQENRHFFTLPNVKQADVRKKWLDLLGLSENDVRSIKYLCATYISKRMTLKEISRPKWDIRRLLSVSLRSAPFEQPISDQTLALQ